MTVQEAIREGWSEAQHLVHVWHHVRFLEMGLEAKRKWVKEWGGLTGTTIEAWLLTDEALSPPVGGV